MSSAPAYKGKEIEASLLRKGFRKNSNKHRHLILFVDGKKTNVRTMVSHANKTYKGALFDFVKKQLKLTNVQLREFIDCTLSEDAYVDILENNGDFN